MKNTVRRILAGITLATATLTGTALTTTTAHAVDTATTVETVDDAVLPAVKATAPVAAPADTWW